MTNSSDSEQGEQIRTWHGASQRFGSSALVFLVGIGVTLVASYLQYMARTSEAREEFSAWCEERQQRLTRTIDTHVEVLYGMRALFDSSRDVSLQEFQRYALDAVDRHSHLRSIGFLRPVVDRDRAQFEAHYSQMFGTPFAIVDPGPNGQMVVAPSRPEYLPLVYTQKNDRMPAGIDALRNPQMPAVLRALQRGSQASAMVVPMIEEGHRRRFVHVYLPVYFHGHDASVAPTSEVFGYVRLRLVLEEILEPTASDARSAGIEATLTLPDAASDTQQGEAEGEVTSDPTGMGRFLWTGAIEFADRSLLLQFRTTANYGRLPTFLASWPMLLMGFALTLLGTFGAYSLSRSRQQSQRLADRLLVQMRERQISEQRTAQSEERYRVLVENSLDAILLFRELRVIFVNRAAVQLFGATSDADLIGRGILDLVHPDSLEGARKRVETMSAKRSILPPFEERLTRLDGSIVDVEVRTVPFLADGELVMQVTIRDITDRRAAERERASLEAALRQSQRLEAIGTFTGGIAHDFNNILSSIVGNIQLVLDDLPRPHPARQSAHEIRNATNRARDLVKRLMAFSREQEAPLTPVELPPLIEEVRQLLRPTMPSGVALEVQIPANTPPVAGNATQLHQVLVNLCTNAWQAMSSGQGRIDIIVSTVDADQARSQSKAPLQGAPRYVCIEVRDDGAGMDPAIIDRIFEPFFTTKRAGEGSGLGLAVVHGIVQGHKGAIRTTTRLGEGTSFHLYLPASESADQKTAVAEKDVARGANQHVLYIDDEEPLVFLVTRVLERHGYRCTGTTDPQQGVDAVRASPGSFDLVITDMNMPGMSGLDVARQVLAIRPELPVLITTGYVRASDVTLTRELGVRDLILKPDTIEELGAIVGRYLEPTPSSPAE